MRFLLGAASLCLLMLNNGALSAVADYDIKAALIYKIGKFVRWPEASFASRVRRASDRPSFLRWCWQTTLRRFVECVPLS